MSLDNARKKRLVVVSERGQGVVEFALVLPILILFFLGTVDFARFLYYQTAIESAARTGAELASNPCPAWSSCAHSGSTPPNNLIMWQASCEAQPQVTLKPQFTSCSPTSGTNWTPTCASGSDCTDTCTANICVSTSTTTTSSCSTTQPCITVAVGYDFHPITPLISAFFHEMTCGGSSGTFTLCATAIGREF